MTVSPTKLFFKCAAFSIISTPFSRKIYNEYSAVV